MERCTLPTILSEEELRFHHIIPHNIVKELIPSVSIKKLSSCELASRKQDLEEYESYVYKRYNLIENTEEHGVLIRAAISNNPHNLVHGPGIKNKQILRGKEPKEKLDDELLSCQSSHFKSCVGFFYDNPSLKTLGGLPKPKPVEFFYWVSRKILCANVKNIKN